MLPTTWVALLDNLLRVLLFLLATCQAHGGAAERSQHKHDYQHAGR
jgi:hypothetical protein